MWTSPATASTQFVAWGDYDGDGDLDFAAGCEDAANAVFENTGGGSFSSVWTSVETEDTSCVKWGDIDGDGSIDFFACNEYDSNRVYINGGGGTFTADWSTSGDYDTYDVSLGDYDSDGDLDILEANFDENNVYRNDDGGNFNIAWTSPESVISYSVTWADLDSDGDLDIFSGNSGANTVYRNSGGGNFPLSWTSVDTITTLSVAPADYDGDGDTDVLAGNTVFSTGQYNRLYRNDGIGSFPVIWTASATDSTYMVSWGDYDGDGDYDILEANAVVPLVPNQVRRNDGGDSFPVAWISIETDSTIAAVWGDYDGDGDIDILAGNYTEVIRIYRNNLAVGNTAPPAPVATAEPDGASGWYTLDWSQAADDFTPSTALSYQLRVGSCSDCDDIMSGEFAPPAGNIFATTGYRIKLPVPGTYYWSVSAIDNTGFTQSAWTAEDSFVVSTYFTTAWSSTETNTTAGLAVGDSDGDGDIDYLAANISAANKLYRNDGSDTFTAIWTSTESENSTSAAFGDYDGDGDPDIITGNASGGANRLYRNDGNNMFTSVWTSPEMEGTQNVRWFDCDGDGDLDHVAANGGGESTRVYTNDGNSMFSSAWASPETDTTTFSDWGDYDDDGDNDLLIGNVAAESNRIYRNEGDCTFNSVWTSSETDQTYSAEWADYDADGDLDALFGNAAGPDRVYSNDGGNSFSLAWSSTETDTTNRFIWGDFDGDGDSDLLSITSSNNRLFQKSSGNNFTSTWTSAESDTSQCGEWADFDGDGDLDFVAGNMGADRIYINETDPDNNPPSTPVANTTSDLTFSGLSPVDVTLSWSRSSDDHTPAKQLTYQVRLATCAGCNNYISGFFAPPRGFAGATDSLTVSLSNPGTYYWAVAAVDATGFATSEWSVESSFDLDSTYPFWSVWESTTDPDTYDIAWGDYDDDGDLDILEGNSNGARVYTNGGGDIFNLVWTQGGSGTAGAVQWGDFDGDGDLDFLAEDRVYGNTGGGNFGLVWSSSEINNSFGAAWGDIDNDGDLDFFVANYFSYRTGNLYENNGAGGFSLAWSSPSSDQSYDAALGDFDSDGDFDILVANYSQANKLFENNGDAIFTTIWTSSASDKSYAAIWSDYDGDGDLDQVIANEGGADRVYRNNGSDSFTLVWSSGETDSSSSLAAGDFDGDGDLDFIVGYSYASDYDRLYRNDGGDSFSTYWTSQFTGMTFGIALGDHDGDGDLDILTGTRSYINALYSNRVIENNTDPVNAAPTTPTPNAVADQYYGPINLDWMTSTDDNTDDALISYHLKLGTCSGCDDMMSGAFAPPSGNAGATSTYRINFIASGTYYWSVAAVDTTSFKMSAWSVEDSFILSTPPFEIIWKSSSRVDYTTAVVWGDIDSDGDLDYVAANEGSSGSPNRVFTGGGDNTFTLLWSSTQSDKTLAAALGDMDGDGDLDFVAGNNSAVNRVYRNNSGASFSLLWSTAETDKTESIALCDADSDGDLDIVTGNNAQANSIYRNNGGGTFTRSWTSTETDITYHVSCADTDSDGDMDILAGNNTDGLDIYANAGGMSFSITWSAADSNGASSAAWGDMDNDGDLDIYSANKFAESRVYRNDGANSFPLAWTAPSSAYSLSISAADYNGDGFTDFIEGNYFQKNNLFRNNGNETFTLLWSSADSDVTRSIAWGDPDNDGDVDQLDGLYNKAVQLHRNNLNPSNTAPSAPAATDEPDGETGPVKLEWAASSDDNTAASGLMYHLMIGTCTGCNDIKSGAFAPPFFNTGATTSFMITIDEPGMYYWSVSAVDNTGFLQSAWSAEDSFQLQTPVFQKTWTSINTDENGTPAWGDFDGDGDLDVIVPAMAAANILYENNGAADFSSIWVSLETYSNTSISWGDYDGDGDLDHITDGQTAIYKNNGGNSFSLAWSSAEAADSTDVAWGDYDRDGDIDAAVSGEGYNCRIYRNDSATVFTLVWSSTETDALTSVSWGDSDSDGDLDLLAAGGNMANLANVVYANNGGDLFSSAWTSTELDSTFRADWWDYDGDGDLDQLAPGMNGKNRVYKNDGGNSFSLAWSSILSDPTTGAAWGDYDGDGDNDFVISNRNTGGENNRVFRNDGNAIFTLVWNFTDSDDSTGVALGDYDNDGDIDLAESNAAGTSMYIYKNLLDPSNSAPSAPSITAVTDTILALATTPVSFSWTTPSDDNSSASALSYMLKVGTCTGCEDVMSAAFAPPGGNIRALTTSSLIFSDTGTYFWSVIAIDNTGFAASAFSSEDSFIINSQPDIFSALGTSAESDETVSVAWADYDGDGDLDLAAGNGMTGVEFSKIYKNNGSGNLAVIWTASVSEFTQGAAWADNDGDGDLDLLLGNYGAANRVYSNDGSDSFSLFWSSAETDNTRCITWGDFDNDGNIDFIAGNNGNNSQYRNDGTGTFILEGTGTDGENTYSISASDYDSDGDLDIALGNRAAANRVYSNSGDGSFTLAWTAPITDDTFSIKWADLDADRTPELVVGNHNTYSNRIYRSSGASSFNTVWTAGMNTYTTSTAWADYDGDGDLDIMFGNGDASAGGAPNFLYRNEGAFIFTLVWVSPESEYTRGIAWGDADADGDLDLLAANIGIPNRLYRNNLSISNSAPTAPVVDVSTGGDLDGNYAKVALTWSDSTDDTTPAALLSYHVRIGSCPDCDDVLSAAFAPPAGNAGASNGMYINLDTAGTYYWSVAAVDASAFAFGAWADEGTFAITQADTIPFGVTWTSISTYNSVSSAWGDYDGDGDLDILIGNNSVSDSNTVYRNDGSRVLTIVWYSDEMDPTSSIAWGDFDNDGDLDFIAANDGDKDNIYRNDGSDSFTLSWSSADSAGTTSAVWGDHDADGDLDFLAGIDGAANRVFENNGAGGFSVKWTSTETENTTSIKWADIDGDGDPDQIVGNQSGALQVYRNDGTGNYSLQWESAETDYTTDVECGDYDGDGDFDILVSNANNEADRIYHTYSNFTFGLLWTTGETDNATDGAWGDFDGDGDFDFIFASDGQANRLYRNSGTGTFSLYWTSEEADKTYSVSWGDYDGNGDIDLLAANKGEANRIYRNNINPDNSPPSAPSVTPISNQSFTSGSKTITLSWTVPMDDITPDQLLTYHVTAGTCSGCGDIISGAFAPPYGNAGPMTSLFISLSATGTYYWSVLAIDSTGFSTSLSSSEDVFSLTDPSADGSLTTGWNLVAFPAVSGARTVQDMFDDAAADIQAFSLSDGKLVVGASSTAAVGHGYWGYSETDAALAPDGTPTATDQTVTVSNLYNGWNLIGNPFTEYLPWSDNIIVDCGAGELSISGAETAGYLSSTVYAYTSSGYDPVNEGGALDPWKGYFLQMYRTGCLIKLKMN